MASDPLEIVVIACILGLGALLQSAVGFGMALFAVPLLVMTGKPLPVAVALALGAALVQTAHGSYVVRDRIHWPRTVSFVAIQSVTLVAGVACMGLLVDRDTTIIKQAIGVAVLLAVTVQIVFRPVPVERLAIGWTLAAASTAGFLSGLVGMGGPPLVLYALAHSWSRDTFRAFIWSQFLFVLPILGGVLALRFGAQILAWMGVGAAMAPIVWAGSRLGLAATARWDRRRVQIAASITLYAIGLAGLLGL